MCSTFFGFLKCYYDLKKEWWMEGGETKSVAIFIRLVRRGGKDGMSSKKQIINNFCYDSTSLHFLC